jgi:hypothetical protein
MRGRRVWRPALAEALREGARAAARAWRHGQQSGVHVVALYGAASPQYPSAFLTRILSRLGDTYSAVCAHKTRKAPGCSGSCRVA